MQKQITVLSSHILVAEALAIALNSIRGEQFNAQARSVVTPNDNQADMLIYYCSRHDPLCVQRVRELRSYYLDAGIVIISERYQRGTIKLLLGAGADACLLSHGGVRQLLSAIETVLSGHNCTLDDTLEWEREAFSPKPEEASLFSQLTQREHVVLMQLLEGKSAKEIGFSLGVGQKTILAHRLRVFDKLSVDNLVTLTRLAIRCGLIEA